MEPCAAAQLLRRKEPATCAAGGQLKRCLGLSDVLFFGVGKMVGAGILVLIGQASRLAGPAVFLSYLLTGAAVSCTALCYADFVSRVPLAGGAYSFVYASMGELPAFVTGWLLLFEYGCGAAALGRGWTGYLLQLLVECGARPPRWVSSGLQLPFGLQVDALAAVLIAALGGVVALGVAQSSALNKAITCVKLGCICLVIIIASLRAHPAANWGSSAADFAPNGLSGIVSAAILVFYSYIGFDAIVSIAEEVECPEKTMPRGMLLCIAVAAALYTLTSIAVTMMTPALQLEATAPLAGAFRDAGVPFMAVVVSFAAVVGLPSGIMMNLTSQARTLMTLARDGLLPPRLAHVNKDTGTPIATTSLACAAALLLSAFLQFETLSKLMSCGTLMALIAVNTGFLCRRHLDAGAAPPWPACSGYVAALVAGCAGLQASTWLGLSVAAVAGVAALACFCWLQATCPPPPVTERPAFTAPGGAAAPLLGTLACTFMLVHGASGHVIWPILAWLAGGVLLYFSYGFQYSKLADEAEPILQGRH